MARFHPVAREGDSLPEFGIDANRVGIRKISLDTAIKNKEIEIGGNFLWGVEASSVGAAMQIAFQDTFGDTLPFGKGSVIKGVRFSRLYITADAQPGEFITLLYAVDESGVMEIVNPSADTKSVELTKATGLESLVDKAVGSGAVESILPANASRRDAIVQVLSTSANGARVGDANINGGRGIELLPGAAVTLKTTNELFAVGISGTSTLLVSYTED